MWLMPPLDCVLLENRHALWLLLFISNCGYREHSQETLTELHWIHSKSKSEVKSLIRAWLFMTPWTVAYHAPLSMGFSRQEYWNGLPFPSSRKRFSLVLSESESSVLLSVTPWTVESMNSPGQDTGVGSPSLLQGIFPTQGLNPGLPHYRQIFFTCWATREAQEYWSGQSIPSPGDFPDPGIEPEQANSLPAELRGKPSKSKVLGKSHWITESWRWLS